LDYQAIFAGLVYNKTLPYQVFLRFHKCFQYKHMRQHSLHQVQWQYGNAVMLIYNS